MAKLKLIKASAGSGKTYQLTGEYLALLFADDYAYKHILAVTFTNKATDEMKSRIVKELYTLSQGLPSGYGEGLMQQYGMDATALQLKAKRTLALILHDYSSFAISTIDKFFQQIIRAFTRELGLSGSYQIDLNTRETIEQIINLMVLELNDSKNKDLLHWILDALQTSINQSKSWRINKIFADLANEVTREDFKLLYNKVDKTKFEKENIKAFRGTMQAIIQHHLKTLKDEAQSFLTICKAHSLELSSFPYGNNSGFGFIDKIVSKGELPEEVSPRALERIDTLDKWYKKNDANQEAITKAYDKGLNDHLKNMVDLLSNETFLSAIQVVGNLDELAVVSDLMTRLEEYHKETGSLFLSDTTELLHSIVAGSDAPFIYEKTASWIDNYMIDEFQDTSNLQWQNFQPLISEALSKDNDNLLVGDVKQSIYRFRGSDWKLINGGIEHDVEKRYIDTKVLDTNWRSEQEIIEFNNAFFEATASIMQTAYNTKFGSATTNTQLSDPNKRDVAPETIVDFTKIYDQVEQKVSPNKKERAGYVCLEFLTEDKKDDSVLPWKEQAIAKTIQQIELLQSNGVRLSQIAILVRENKEAIAIAEALLAYQKTSAKEGCRYDVISDEALLLRNARSVKAVVAFLKHLAHPKDRSLQLSAVSEFYRFRNNTSGAEAIVQSFQNKDREYSTIDFDPEVKTELNRIAQLPLYEMVEAYFALCNEAIDHTESVYIQAFLDHVLRFSSQVGETLDSFLTWWNERGERKTLFTSDSQDAIRILTIHKSKGLEFDVVLMPFLDWELDHKPLFSPILWCQPSETPFAEMPLLPITYGSRLANTIFRYDYFCELAAIYADNLNLLYVAFTRAKHTLIGYLPQPSVPKKSGDFVIDKVSKLVWQVISNQRSTEIQGNNTAVFIELGSPLQVQATEGNAPTLHPTTRATHWLSQPFDDRLKLKLSSIGYFGDDGSRDYGNMMHAVMANIQTAADFDTAFQKSISQGELTEEQAEEIRQRIHDAITHPSVSAWFDGSFEVLNETQILQPPHAISRPDRVMIDPDKVIVVDYKFGQIKQSKYGKQVRNYVDYVKKMGYPNVEGYIYYVILGEVEQV